MPRAEPHQRMGEGTDRGGRRAPVMRPSRQFGLRREQLQHLALEVAFAVGHARKMRAVDRRLDRRQRRRSARQHRLLRSPRGVFARSSAISDLPGALASPLARDCATAVAKPG